MRSVDPKLYKKSYYLTDCAGYNEFKRSKGEILDPRLSLLVRKIPIKKEMRVIDIGCGRGELVFWAARKGATCVGIDYAEHAIKLAKDTLKDKNQKVKKRCDFITMNAKELKFPDASFDLVLAVEVIEHLYPEEWEKVLPEVKRVLKPGGTLFFHTEPNRFFNDLTYRLYSYPVGSFLILLSNAITKGKYPPMVPPGKIRSDSQRMMHVNEVNYHYLRKSLEKFGFKGRIYSTNIVHSKPILSWKDRIFNILVFLYPLSLFPPLNIIFGQDFYSQAKQK